MLDLDQTLLHYVPVSQLSDKEKYLMEEPESRTLDRISADQRRVVIVDDNPSAWPQHKPNLLQVSQYIYFRYQMTNNNSEEDSYAEKESDECRSNGALSNVLKLLQKAHTRFQQEEDSNDLRLLIRD
uniref:protein-serine/threonine phosphatase n=1 Tax=Brassica oleracea TaxID=3712 RepID=A0A3P6DSW7_BRAOL|nr:unnamed protein product [Brassica oleracea]